MCSHTGDRFTCDILAYLTYKRTLLRYSNVFIHSNIPLYFVSLMMALSEQKYVGNYKIFYKR